MQRRDFLLRSGAFLGLGLAGAGSRVLAGGEAISAGPAPAAKPAWPLANPPIGPLGVINARPDRILKITVCTRPFRAQGPRVEAERIGQKLVVHQYGHGGSGWSLSWGSGTLAAQLATAGGEREIAVIGCGAIGLTTALILLRAGRRVTIYAKERAPFVRSTWATGVWSPDSRVCTEENATPAYAKVWEQMTRTSFRAFQDLLGLPGDPVEWRERFTVNEIPYDEARKKREAEGLEGPVKFGKFTDYVKDLTPAPEDLAPGTHPFAQRYVRRATSMLFSITAYQKLLMTDFLAEGGRIEQREFFTPADFATLPEKTLVNCTGYGARALLGDESIVPVRGQLALLIPQPEVTYGLVGEGFSTVPRRDGLVVQAGQKTDHANPDTTVVRAETDAALLALAKVCAAMKRPA